MPVSPHNPNAEVLDSRAITMLLSIIRAKETNQEKYVNASDRLMNILAEEGIARLNCCQPCKVVTPCGEADGVTVPPSHEICGVDIIRSGGILLEAVRKVCPDSK